MIAPDLDSAMARLHEMVQRGRNRRAVHRRGNFHRMRHSRFSFARRAMDQEPADPVRRVPRQPGGAQRIPGGGASPWRSSSAAPSRAAAIARSPASIAPARCRRSSRKTSTICIRPLGLRRNTSSNCTATQPSPCASTAASATNWPGCAGAWTRPTAARPIARLAAAYIKTATVSFGQAMPDAAMRRAAGTDAVLRSVPGDRLVARGLAGGRISP